MENSEQVRYGVNCNKAAYRGPAIIICKGTRNDINRGIWLRNAPCHGNSKQFQSRGQGLFLDCAILRPFLVVIVGSSKRYYNEAFIYSYVRTYINTYLMFQTKPQHPVIELEEIHRNVYILKTCTVTGEQKSMSTYVFPTINQKNMCTFFLQDQSNGTIKCVCYKMYYRQ